ncbi:MAG: hypothetical protein IH845_02235 [Nanoarchaeota archaeon]|nr:hypothetical protein [Nanoarchaeota archaeon]
MEKVIKEEKPIFLKIFSVILIILVTESIAIFYAARKGFPIPKVLLILQIPLIIFMLGFAYIKNRRIWKRKIDEYGINLSVISKNSKTDLDAFYTILKNKKEISVISVSNLFKIKEDLAMEWSRILESGGLATIEYPGFGSPKVIIIEKEKKISILKSPPKKLDKKTGKKVPVSNSNSTQELKTGKKVPEKVPAVLALNSTQGIKTEKKVSQKTSPEPNKIFPNKILPNKVPSKIFPQTKEVDHKKSIVKKKLKKKSKKKSKKK